MSAPPQLERFARILARALLIELSLAAPIKPDEVEHALGVCWRCGTELRAHERPEHACDDCLRLLQWRGGRYTA
jgi:hypothetical protein